MWNKVNRAFVHRSWKLKVETLAFPIASILFKTIFTDYIFKISYDSGSKSIRKMKYIEINGSR